MKKTSFLLIIIYTLQISYSQKIDYKIDWKEHISSKYDNNTITLPSFQDKNYNFSFVDGLKFSDMWKPVTPININSAKIINIQSEIVNNEYLKDLNVSLISENVKLSVHESKIRDDLYYTFEVNPIYKERGVIKKLLSFSIAYEKNNPNTSLSKSVEIQNSSLNSGQWYRFAIDTTGVYKLDKEFFNSLGINTNNLNPKKIKLFGHGGQSLALLNSETISYDLIQNAVRFIGESDGVFNDEDYLLFFGIGPKYFNEENNSHINPYSDEVFYYINISNEDGLRMVSSIEPDENPSLSFTTFHDYKFIEKDDYNIGLIGRRWFGHRFYFENSRSFDFQFENLITSSPLKLKLSVASTAESNTYMEITINGSSVSNLSLPAVEDGNLAAEANFNNDVFSSSDSVTLDLFYNNNGNPSAIAYLDYISIEAERELIFNDLQFQIKHNSIPNLIGIGEFIVANSSSMNEIWDISSPYNPTYLVNSANNSEFNFKFNLGSKKLYQVVSYNDTYRPVALSNSNVENQNLKGTIFQNAQGEFQDVDYIIISPKILIGQAERLANIHRSKNNLVVKVVDLETIYQEFSSGMQDIAGIRNFIKYVYDNASSIDKRIRYLCMFGDASFDYKDRVNGNTNIVPAWLSINSFSLTSSFISDDFFGMMDENEGTMINGDKLDIAVGRILAQNPMQATEMVNKIESYYNSNAYGNWRNNFLLISDDVDDLSDKSLQETTDLIAEDVKASKPFLNVKKIHSDSYAQQTSSGGSRYPEVNDAIFDALEVGAVVVNYFGHGGEDGLALERIFDKINAQELNNPNKLSCFVTVTCEFTKFDNPLRPTAGEYLFWNKIGGAIALITTTRQIFINVGVQFNTALSQYLFDYENSQSISMAEALRLTKNDPAVTNNSQRRLVFFIGDPAIKLPLASPEIVVTKINDEDISSSNITLQALAPAKLEGYLLNEQGNIMNNYNGTVTATIYDKNIQRSTLGNDGTTLDGELIILDYEAMGEVLFRGQASVENGEFEINFIVPRDIVIPVGPGKISLYSKSESPLSDQRGYSFEMNIGGVNINAPEDNMGPDIELFMNDENFISGGITNENPTLIAKLFDDSGINTSSGVGHDIVALLDGDETNPYILNDYYLADIDSYQSGQLSYPLRKLSPGRHTISLKAWDVYNNSSTKEIHFTVFNQNESLELKNVLNYPNPFVNYTEFWFNHNSSGVLDVFIQIFTISGKLVKTINSQTNSNGINSTISRNITWDGRDDFGNKIGKGVYVYKLSVKSQLNGLKSEKIEKLVIL